MHYIADYLYFVQHACLPIRVRNIYMAVFTEGVKITFPMSKECSKKEMKSMF